MLQVIIIRSTYLDVFFIENNISLVTGFRITCNYIMQYWIYESQNASVISIEHSILFIQHGVDLGFTNYVKIINEVFWEMRICFIWMSAKILSKFNHHISTFDVDFVVFTDLVFGDITMWAIDRLASRLKNLCL